MCDQAVSEALDGAEPKIGADWKILEYVDTEVGDSSLAFLCCSIGLTRRRSYDWVLS